MDFFDGEADILVDILDAEGVEAAEVDTDNTVENDLTKNEEADDTSRQPV
jgi:hypothetical protein